MRKEMVQLRQKLVNEKKTVERVGTRSYEEMIDLALKNQLDHESLTSKEVKILVDCLGVEDRNMKSHDKKLKAGKPVLLDYARKYDILLLDGDETEAKIGSKTDWSLTPSKAFKILEKEGKLKLLDTVLSVKVTEFRNYLGNDLFEKYSSKDVSNFSSVSFKKRAPRGVKETDDE